MDQLQYVLIELLMALLDAAAILQQLLHIEALCPNLRARELQMHVEVLPVALLFEALLQ